MKLFEWQQEFDGNQPAIGVDEQQRVSREFHRYVGALLGKTVAPQDYLENANQWRKLGPPGGRESDTTRFNISYNGRRLFTPHIYAYRLLSEQPQRTLSSTYEPDSNDVICRTDAGGDLQQEIARSRSSIFTEVQLPENFTDDEMFDLLINAAQHRVRETAANKQLERGAGLNGQPIGRDELNALKNTLDAALPIL